jgi:hypothetical protein
MQDAADKARAATLYVVMMVWITIKVLHEGKPACKCLNTLVSTITQSRDRFEGPMISRMTGSESGIWAGVRWSAE